MFRHTWQWVEKPWFKAQPGCCVVFLGKIPQCLSTQAYKIGEGRVGWWWSTSMESATYFLFLFFFNVLLWTTTRHILSHLNNGIVSVPVSSEDLYSMSWFQDTPVPGSYELKDFVKEMHGKRVITTYGFKNAGRKRNADPSRKGDKLMPGLYKHGTSIDELNKQHVTYSFKSCDRYHTPTALVGYMDKVFCRSWLGFKFLIGF